MQWSNRYHTYHQGPQACLKICSLTLVHIMLKLSSNWIKPIPFITMTKHSCFIIILCTPCITLGKNMTHTDHGTRLIKHWLITFEVTLRYYCRNKFANWFYRHGHGTTCRPVLMNVNSANQPCTKLKTPNKQT